MKKEGMLTAYSQELRKNMTKEERHLWYDFLKNLPVTVNRQKVIGCYIADFYIATSKIAIEIDGSQHFEQEYQRADIVRDTFFKQKGIRVLRYSNYEINAAFDAVCQDILNNLDNTSSVTCR
ncbi:MAG: endonuclease domain-containing protein [Clostridia bacterium]|nr:endonuclease domain-containing protein [Clostridia bacterium]